MLSRHGGGIESSVYASFCPEADVRPLVSAVSTIGKAKTFDPYSRWGKRAFDSVAAAVLLVACLPLIAVLLVAVAMDGGWPIFAHTRIGRNGRSFRCYKIRTMVVDAEVRLARLLAENPLAAQEWATGYKLRVDPRITRIGNFLRRTSLDELPQLWNVIRGDMSLVGPRPVTSDEMPLYGGDAEVYCSVRPGLTGLWQVSGRNGMTFAERVQLDRSYATSVSIGGDAAILLRTVTAVLGATGC